MATAQVIAFAESINFIKKLGIKNILNHEPNHQKWARKA